MATKEVYGAIIELDSDSLRMHQPNGKYSASAVISMEGNRVVFNSNENKLNTFDFKKKDNGQWLLIRENNGAFLCEKIE